MPSRITVRRRVGLGALTGAGAFVLSSALCLAGIHDLPERCVRRGRVALRALSIAGGLVLAGGLRLVGVDDVPELVQWLGLGLLPLALLYATSHATLGCGGRALGPLFVLAGALGGGLHLAALQAAGLNGTAPPGAGSWKQLISTLTSNWEWLIATGIGLAFMVVAGMVIAGSQRGIDHVFRIGGGVVVILVVIPAVLK